MPAPLRGGRIRNSVLQAVHLYLRPSGGMAMATSWRVAHLGQATESVGTKDRRHFTRSHDSCAPQVARRSHGRRAEVRNYGRGPVGRSVPSKAPRGPLPRPLRSMASRMRW